MSRGSPDYGNPNYEIASSQSDLNDLIVYQKGFASLDGRGRTVVYDDLSRGLNSFIGLNSGGGIEPRITHLNEGGYLGGLTCELRADGIGARSAIERTFPIISSGRVGLEVAFCPNDSSLPMLFELHGEPITGSPRKASIYWDNGNQILMYGTGAGYNEMIPYLQVASNLGWWVRFKVVFDFVNNEYVRFINGGREWDLSGYPLMTGYADRLGMCTFLADATQVSGYLSAIGYFGSFAVTADEP